MWMVLHVDEAVYTEYEQLRHVKLSVLGSDLHRKGPKIEIDALSAEGLVRGIATDRSLPVTLEFLSQVCRDHAPGIYGRYLKGRPGIHPLGGNTTEVLKKDMLSEIRFEMVKPRPLRIFA